MDQHAPPPTPKRYTVYLKDGRTAESLGVRLDPNIERMFQGQSRSFVVVSDGRVETAVFMATDVLGWTVGSLQEPISNGANHEAAMPHPAAAPTTYEQPRPAAEPSSAPVYSAPVLGG